jgi:hypothetical protein
MGIGGIERLSRIADPNVELLALFALNEDALAHGINLDDADQLPLNRFEPQFVIVAVRRPDFIRDEVD